MLIAEAAAVGRVLSDLPDDAFPLANIGSQSRDFVTRTQPWIDADVFAPLDRAGRKVVNVDLTPNEGVDVVADVGTAEGRAAVRGLGAQSVLCSNLLEHVEDPAHVLAGLAELVSPGAYLVLSGPLHYPYHPDPIDNGFRPRAREVAGMLPAGLAVLQATDLSCRRLLRYDLDRVRKLFLERGRQHSGEAADAAPLLHRLKRLALRGLWTLRRPSCYLVVAAKADA